MWNRFWFPDVPLVRLAIFRILTLLLTLYDLLEWKWLVFANVHYRPVGFPSIPWNPIYAFEILGVDPPGERTAMAVFMLLIASTILGVLGASTRLACALVAILSFYWSGLFYSLTQATHTKIALTFALFALPLSPAGTRLSVDAWVARWTSMRDKNPVGNAPAMPDRDLLAGWPLRLTQITIAIGYFFSGASKLIISGLDWMNGYTLQAQMLGSGQPLAEFFARDVTMSRLMSFGIIAVQLTFPLVLVWPMLRWLHLPAVTIFHLAAWQTLTGGLYITLWFMLISFIELEKVPSAVSRLAAAALRGWRVCR